MVTQERGQTHTLEAFTASILLVGGVIFALQVTTVTPLTASTSSQHIENQQYQLAIGVLDGAVENSSLRESVLYWNESGGRFHAATDDGYYSTGGPPTVFGGMVNRTFRDRGIAFNVNVLYVTKSDAIRREQMVRFGEPSDNAVSARRTVTLYDNNSLTAPSSSGTVEESTTFYAPDVAPDSLVYNVVQVEVVVWRM